MPENPDIYWLTDAELAAQLRRQADELEKKAASLRRQAAALEPAGDAGGKE